MKKYKVFFVNDKDKSLGLTLTVAADRISHQGQNTWVEFYVGGKTVLWVATKEVLYIEFPLENEPLA